MIASKAAVFSALAEKIIKNNQIQKDLFNLWKGTGPRGMIMKADVLDYVFKRKLAATQSSILQATEIQNISKIQQPIKIGNNKYIDFEIDQTKQNLGQQFMDSKKYIPHYYLTSKIYIDRIENFIQDLNDKNIEIEDILIKSLFQIIVASLSSQKIVEANQSWQNTFLQQFKNFDLQITNNNGQSLVLQQINKKSLLEIQKLRKSKSENSKGLIGSFALRFDEKVDNIQEIIQQPHACILSIGKINYEILLDESQHKKYRQINLSCDHRVIDGAIGASWLQNFVKFVENPELIFI